jgi:small-conductance mechanosensitive channel
MKVIFEFFQQNWLDVLIPLGILAVTLAAGWVARKIIFGTLERWAAKTKAHADDLLVESLRGPFMIWVLILGLHLATQFSASPRPVAALISKLLLILWVISLTSVAARLAGKLVHRYGTMSGTILPVTSLTQNVARLSVVAVGILILLNLLGISITPILTALGVGGLAVALALQDTLANFFAGIYISVANQVRIGDYIKLESGEEGYVMDISWRSTSVRMLSNNMIIIPNAKLAQAIVTNYHLPEKRMSLLVPISVSYDCDPEQVERILIEEALSGAKEISGLLAEPAPFVRFIPGFGDSSLNFTLICQISEFVDQYLAQHELRKRIFKRFRAAGIEIPFPIRTVYLKGGARDGEQSDKLKAAGGHA